MLKNVIILSLALVASALLVENRQACAEVGACTWVRAMLDRHDMERKNRVETLKRIVELRANNGLP